MTGAPQKGARRGFRTDIQALRAIAVLLVLIYHLRPNRMPGGYIGVDVFFVISGFLITGHLLKEATRTGRVRIGAFWAARARRILPASLVTIAVTILVTAMVTPVTQLNDLLRQALSSIFYVQNWTLAGDSVDYLAAENEATAFQHFWSLSVEEQFYLFWPLLVILALWIVARRRASAGSAESSVPLRRALVVIFGAIVLASLIYSIVTVADGRADAYFITTTRVWELGAGGLLAIVSRPLPRAWRYILTYAGLALIAASAFVLTNDTPFPGIAALPVIVGTMAVILAGDSPADDAGLARFDPWTFASNLRLAQWFGDRSYSLYLWHFPVVIIWTTIVDGDIGYLDLIGMLLLSLVMADLSYRFIEQPVRRSAALKNSTPRSLILALASMVATAAIALVYLAPITTTTTRWNDLASQAQNLPVLGIAAAEDGSVPLSTSDVPMLTPSPLQAADDRSDLFSNTGKCVGLTRAAETPVCDAGDPDADTTVALIGDSHAGMYGSAFAEIAEDEGWHLRTYLHNSCPLNPIPREIEVARELTCTEPNKAVMKQLLANPPDLVVTTWFHSAKFVDDDATETPGARGFAEYWNQLEDAGTHVLVIRDTPNIAKDVPDCAARHYDDPRECGRAPQKALDHSALIDDALALAPRTSEVDFTDRFCTEEICPGVIGNVIAYSDGHHLTETYTATMIPLLADAAESALN